MKISYMFDFVTTNRQCLKFFGCCIVNSKLYVIGGVLDIENYTLIDGVEIYDIEDDVWENGPSLPLTLTGFGCSDIF